MSTECYVSDMCGSAGHCLQNLTGYFTPDNTLIVVNGMCQTKYVLYQTAHESTIAGLLVGGFVGAVVMGIIQTLISSR